MGQDLVHSYEIYIRSSPDEVWRALTDPSLTPRYLMGLAVVSDWTPGSPIRQVRRDGAVWNEGTVLEVDPPRRLVTSFRSLAEDARGDPSSRVSWTLEAVDDLTFVTLVHDGFEERNATYDMVASGWSLVLSALKTLLETGETLRVPAPEPFGNGEEGLSGSRGWNSPAMAVRGLTIQLHVADGTAGRSWYERLLGRPPDLQPFGDDSFVEWQFRPGYYELHVLASVGPKRRQGRLRLGVADVEAARRALIAIGMEVSEIDELADVVRWCDFDDPWQNRLGLYQDLARFRPRPT